MKEKEEAIQKDGANELVGENYDNVVNKIKDKVLGISSKKEMRKTKKYGEKYNNAAKKFSDSVEKGGRTRKSNVNTARDKLLEDYKARRGNAGNFETELDKACLKVHLDFIARKKAARAAGLAAAIATKTRNIRTKREPKDKNPALSGIAV